MTNQNKAILVAGLGYGDEGKGAAVDYLCRKHNASLVIRYNGGHQAAHNVVLPDGKHHTFSQFGSGTFIPGVQTHLSKYMMVNPIAMVMEESYLQNVGVTDAFERLTINENALVVTPFDRELNILRDRINNYGTCGVGIGETRLYNITYGADSIFAGDLEHEAVCEVKLKIRQQRAYRLAESLGQSNPMFTGSDIIDVIMHKYKNFLSLNPNIGPSIAIHNHETVVFEGAQGVLLDEREEFEPHNTWSNTTFDNADAILDGYKFNGERIRVGCIRSYMTRHGNGPLYTEDKRLDTLSEPHNIETGFQGKFRRGWFDKAAVGHALDICGGVDEIHMSHVDRMPYFFHRITDADMEVYLRNLERLLETPITVTGYGPTYQDRRERGRYVNARRRSAEVGAGLSLSSAR